MRDNITPAFTLDLAEGITYPTELATAAQQQDAAYDRWAEAESSYLLAELAIDTATAADQQLLTDAVKNGKGDPGTPNETKARRALVVAEEVERQARASFEAKRGAVSSALEAAAPALVAQAVTHARSAIRDYEASVARLTSDFYTAANALALSGNPLRMLAPYIERKVRYDIQIGSPEITIPTAGRIVGNLEGLIDQLEQIDFTE